MEKIKTKNLLLSGDSWMHPRSPTDDEQSWYQEIFDSEKVTNLAVGSSGNKYIAESVMSYILENPGVDHVFVNWSGLNRIDVPIPLGVKAIEQDQASKDRTTSASRYWSNSPVGDCVVKPTGDRPIHEHIDERLVWFMYQEEGYTSVKNQSLISIINLQDFLRVRRIPYLFCFMYDYTNTDFDYDHITGSTATAVHPSLGSIRPDHPFLRELDRSCCLEPAGLDWALTQDEDHFTDRSHLSQTGYRAWAREMLRQYNITKRSRQD